MEEEESADLEPLGSLDPLQNGMMVDEHDEEDREVESVQAE